MSRFRLSLVITLIITLIWSAFIIFPYFAKAEPHPRTHVDWIALSNQTVVLKFIEDGRITQWLYQMVHEAEPATDCTHSYGKKTFTLITYDMTHPYRYTLYMKPIMWWDAKLGEFVEVE